jgi:pilus assembly protein CpaB
LKNRTIIGIVCIVLALVVTFAVAPLVNKLSDSRTDIVRLKNDIVQGHMIQESDVEVVTVGSTGLPTNIITKKEAVVGKFAACDLKANTDLLQSMISDKSDSADDVFHTLDGKKQAISITISSFAGGLSGKLENGDIVSLVIFENETNEATIPGGLTYVKVITTTTAEGFDKDELTPNEDGTYELPTTLTLLVNPAQAKMLVEYENRGVIHADLVYRGDSKTAQKFLDAQDLYFELLAEKEDEEPSEPDENKPSGGNNIIQDANDIIWGTNHGGNNPTYNEEGGED